MSYKSEEAGFDARPRDVRDPAARRPSKEYEAAPDSERTTQQQHLATAMADKEAGALSPPTSAADDDGEYKYEKLAQKTPRATDHLSITLGPPVIVLFDIIVPCIIYYTWYNARYWQWQADCAALAADGAAAAVACPAAPEQYNDHIMGYAVISFGFGELYILIARVARLLLHRDLCAPLLSRNRWELDATSWVYGVAMIVALIPFVVGATKVIPELYLYGPAFLMSFLGVLMVATLIPFPLPIGINSHKRGTPIRPFIYYAVEDFIAVDGLQDREFRVRYNARYNASPAFRRLFVMLTLWWIAGVLVYLGCVSAVIWTLEFHYAFGLSLGVLFAYIAIWGGVSFFWVQHELERERLAYEREHTNVDGSA